MPYPVLLDPELEAGGCTATSAGPAATCSTAPACSRSSTTARATTAESELAIQECLGELDRELDSAARPAAPGGRAGRAARAPDRGHRAAGGPRPARAGARLGRRRGLDRGRRRRAPRRASATAPAARSRCFPAPDVEPGLYEIGRDGRGGVARRCGCTACSSRPCRQRPPDLLREHEAHVLLDDLELRRRPRCRARGRTRPAAERAPRGRSRPERDARRRACPRATPRAPAPRCRSGASRRRGRARPRPAGWSSTSCASRSRARGRTRAAIWRTASWRLVVA